MVFVPPKDRVLERSTSNSQTVFTVAGAVDTSYNAFSAHMAVGDWTIGAVIEPGVAFKSGKLTYSATNEVTVDSTEGESKGTFSSGGTKEVMMGMPASRVVDCVGLIEMWPTSELRQSRLKCNGASISRSTYPWLASILVKDKTVTFTNGSSDIGCTAHGFSVGDPVKLFNSGGALPTNFTAGTHGLVTAGTVYYVIAAGLTADVFRVSATVGGAAVSAGSAGSGTHTATVAPHGDGDGSTTCTLPEMRGEFPRFWDDGRAIDTSRVIGSAQLDAFQGHWHALNYAGGGTAYAINSGAGGAPASGGGNALTDIAANFTVRAPTTDGSNGTPRTAAETRPRSVALMATIRYA